MKSFRRGLYLSSIERNIFTILVTCSERHLSLQRSHRLHGLPRHRHAARRRLRDGAAVPLDVPEICAELGTFVTFPLGVVMGLPVNQAAATATIGGADGPMVLFASLMLAPEIFVPITVVGYLTSASPTAVIPTS